MSDVPTRVDESDRAASPADLTETSYSGSLYPFGPPRFKTEPASPEHDDEFIQCDLEECIMGEMNEEIQRFYKVYLATGMYDRARVFRNGRYTVEEKEKMNEILVKRMPGRLEPVYPDRSRTGPKEKPEEQKCEKKKSQARTEENTSPRPRLVSSLEAAKRPEFHKRRCQCQQNLRTGDFDDRKKIRPGDRKPTFYVMTCVNCGCKEDFRAEECCDRDDAKEALGAEECCVLIDKM